MRALHVIPAVAPRYGGPSSSIVQMCRALRDVDVSTLVATTDADGDGVLDVPLGTTTTWDGTDAIFFRRQWSEAFKYSPALGAWLERHVATFDVVHIHGPLSYASLAASRAASRHHVPFIVRPLGSLDAWSLRQKANKKRLLLPFVTRMLGRAAAVHCTSIEELDDVSATFGLRNGVVIPLGIALALLADNLATDDERRGDRYVLALSRLHPVKNLESLIDGFADLADANERRGWRLLIGGSGDDAYASSLDRAIARRKASGYVTRIGWTDGDAKRALVRGASIFALPSHHENFGVGLVEALAAGVPAIVGRGVHLSSDIERAGAGWVVDGTPQSIRAALEIALSDESVRRARGDAARRFAARFAWPQVAHQLIDLYRQVSPQSRHATVHQPTESAAIGAGR
ncbi:MAG: glycosyltransferase [Vicinamibacterales bacterium]